MLYSDYELIFQIFNLYMSESGYTIKYLMAMSSQRYFIRDENMQVNFACRDNSALCIENSNNS